MKVKPVPKTDHDHHPSQATQPKQNGKAGWFGKKEKPPM